MKIDAHDIERVDSAIAEVYAGLPSVGRIAIEVMFTPRPIATAPKDGRPVLLWDAGGVYLGRWCGYGWFDHSDESYIKRPSHWLPVPDVAGSAL